MFPKLDDKLLAAVDRIQAPYHALVQRGYGLSFIERSLVSRWLTQCEPLADWLIGNDGGQIK